MVGNVSFGLNFWGFFLLYKGDEKLNWINNSNKNNNLKKTSIFSNIAFFGDFNKAVST